MENELLIDSSLQNLKLDKLKRRKLLPWWIKMFCWLFMIFGGLSIISLFLGFTGIKPDLSFYGFETNEPFSLFGLIVISLGLFNGITAYLLWTGNDIAIKVAKINAITGLLACLASMFLIPFLQPGFHMKIRIEIMFLIPYLMKLNKIQSAWEGENRQYIRHQNY
ncbi:hypothetical protein [Marinigracilibium pacificum]|uniref:Uncharacterized protein n=1 Tax=Marinigracilibium pacificum TaxID=2729599 RepID=A0A848IYT7_9BACT|nr:hypothetical protein [Marinigracilibium pacificum]NMM47450.1 hypothetical protein [Marinigracilibium pacificum]